MMMVSVLPDQLRMKNSRDEDYQGYAKKQSRLEELQDVVAS